MNVRVVYNGNIKMSPGKLAAQAVHAALAAYGIAHGSVVVLQGSVRKVEAMDVQIRDAGLTELKPGTLTAGASLERVPGYADHPADVVEDMCHWRQDRGDARSQTHEEFHFGHVCPYEAMASVLRGKGDPRDV